MAKKILDSLKELENELKAAPIVLEEFAVEPPKRKAQPAQDVRPASALYLHGELDGLLVHWTPKEADDPNVEGLARILSVEKILRDWQGVVYFDFTPPDDRIRNFHPIDFFVDEACAGMYLNEAGREDPAVYLCNFGDEPIDLHLDVAGYFEMLKASRCFLYWQYAIIEISNKKENPTSARFKEWMPRLFPKFDWKDYVHLYRKLKR